MKKSNQGDFPKAVDAEEAALIERAQNWPEYPALANLDQSGLGRIARQQGIDFATALLFDRVLRSTEHGAFIRRIEQLRHEAQQPLPVRDLTIAIAPGAFYEEYPETGASGRELRDEAERLGCRTELIPTDGVGTLAANGRTICDWLAERGDEKIVIVSLSKGGADVKRALSSPDAAQAFRNVAAWVSIGGILNGSPMVSWLTAHRLHWLFCRLLMWFSGRDHRFLLDLERRPNGALDFELELPRHLRLVHVAGFPLQAHLQSRRARRWHRRLAEIGPNDSVTLLLDVCRAPGLVLPIWGTDHYLNSRWQPRSLIGAILRYLVLEGAICEERLLERTVAEGVAS